LVSAVNRSVHLFAALRYVSMAPAFSPGSVGEETPSSASGMTQNRREAVATRLVSPGSPVGEWPGPQELNNAAANANANVARPANLNGRISGNGPGQSMLHLDGAALGRWAIQYLERALSKPGNGMTGIDPRATKPRGHVSPF
jgi:hypothetical protein